MTDTAQPTRSPWPALWALVIGFFMILVDSTIVSVAIPHIMAGLDAGINAVIWVTSAYLLAYAVPLLVTGRLGDRFGPRPVYLAGLALFTAASLACGLAPTIEVLIVARVVQGLGAALMTPQTMAVIMRTFAPNARGAAMGLWGGVAGVALLVGPLLGGALVDALGWEWIFFINVPVGVVGFVLVTRLVPRLPLHAHSFDWLGVVLSAAGMFLVVFGIQEGETYDWGTMPILGLDVPLVGVIVAGVVFLGAFVVWQARNRREPLVPLGIFRDRNFSLASIAIACVGFVVTAMAVPIFLYAQGVRGLTPTQSALLLIPTALGSGLLSPVASRFLQARDPRLFTAAGILGIGGAVAWYGLWVQQQVDVWLLLLPSALMGVSSAFVWGPLGIVATRSLDPQVAGAGSGVYNTVRQMGAVIGSAAIAAAMTWRIDAEVGPGAGEQVSGGAFAGTVPAQVAGPIAGALGQALLVPAAVAALGVVAALCFARPRIGAAPALAKDDAASTAVAAAD
ncbi:DHA2 family efflux MFS transporter permease subunit [Agrococcus sp. SGAir0287]|uniref:DHA2 family efflux MFS transporter permease subunit n=1 Tax=Agrococcus sp. SGAir0287 TaxID=2070347 RepID=UPI0010CD001F|nr:DHA2 family efflux MFS transporter permease subunit [Agrococcus sp. SGAir0287]QCR19242.1 MFS transporter [Agrococcus sp. SGAir0287]